MEVEDDANLPKFARFEKFGLLNILYIVVDAFCYRLAVLGLRTNGSVQA